MEQSLETLSLLWQNIESRLDSSHEGWRHRIDEFGQVDAVRKRSVGRAWSDSETFEATLMAVLSNNTDWSKIQGVRAELPEVFSGFSLRYYAELSESDISGRIEPWFRERRAGSMTLKRDLVNLVGAACRLMEYSRAHGSAETYFVSLVRQLDNDPNRAALRLGTPGDEYKLPALGVPLAAEALKNLGFDLAKPDRHIHRAVASFGLIDFGPWPDRTYRRPPQKASYLDIMEAVQRIGEAAGVPVVLVDNAIWLLCARSGLYLTNPQLEELAV